ncbi:MAG: hypothetical protein KAH62_03905 [Desulfobacula sp.]|nr:hypothetical protein [Desulfobacula sp.]
MLNSIKKYLKKAKEEVSREYSIHSSDQPLDYSYNELPKIWTGVDLDGTLAYYDRMSSYDEVGEPVPAMLVLVKKMINNGIRVKIFTARVQDPEQLPIIRKWLKDNGLPELEITNIKDYNMRMLYDDRCIQVERNTGRLIVDN